MKQRFALLVLKLMRWTPIGPAPEAKKYVMLCAPHTTNWDLPALLVATWSQGKSVNFLGKHQLFRGPMNWFMRSLGGIPVRREGRYGMVESLTAEFAAADEIGLAIPAAGTRSYSDHWKSGFYRIALAADVPIVCAFVDYKTKTLGFGPTMTPTGDPDVDILFFQEFYADKVGKFPEKKSEIRFRPDQTNTES
ncbi:1-acyl-sn-glycerol-3-phosphate acyltransferase [Ilumatobacter sp.]|uniref:1-acyl-sn-glycerol-3-phosphate acyltransferase n=1 Tax=Ilumatobacter sp. TaxID=1967498 RepID=UPI00374FFF20